MGISSLSLVFSPPLPTLGSGRSLWDLGGRRTLEQRPRVGSVFIKPSSFNRNVPCALHCSRKFRSPRNVQAAPDSQTPSGALGSPRPPLCPPASSSSLLVLLQPPADSLGRSWVWPPSPAARAPAQSQQAGWRLQQGWGWGGVGGLRPGHAVGSRVAASTPTLYVKTLGGSAGIEEKAA